MAIDPSSTKVLITGVNGFIGLHTVLHFLQRGYNLCATVRTQEQGGKVRQTITKHTDTHKLEFNYADLTRDENWDQAAAGCDFVLHIASPFPTEAHPYEGTIVEMAQSMIPGHGLRYAQLGKWYPLIEETGLRQSLLS